MLSNIRFKDREKGIRDLSTRIPRPNNASFELRVHPSIRVIRTYATRTRFPRTSRKTIVVGDKPKLIRINLRQQRIAWGNATLHRVISFEIQASLFRQTTRSSSRNEALTRRGSHGAPTVTERIDPEPRQISRSVHAVSLLLSPPSPTQTQSAPLLLCARLCPPRRCAPRVFLPAPLEFSNARHWRHPFRVSTVRP